MQLEQTKELEKDKIIYQKFLQKNIEEYWCLKLVIPVTTQLPIQILSMISFHTSLEYAIMLYYLQ